MKEVCRPIPLSQGEANIGVSKFSVNIFKHDFFPPNILDLYLDAINAVQMH